MLVVMHASQQVFVIAHLVLNDSFLSATCTFTMGATIQSRTEDDKACSRALSRLDVISLSCFCSLTTSACESVSSKAIEARSLCAESKSLRIPSQSDDKI